MDADSLEQILKDYGLLLLSEKKEIVAEQEFEFGDWLQELSNVAKGRAADLLARAIDNSIELSIPSVSMIEKGELRFSTLVPETGYAVSQGFIGAGIAGEMVQLFNDKDGEAIRQLLHAAEGSSEEPHIEAIMDLANILGGAFLNGFCEQLQINFSMGQPSIRPWHQMMLFLQSQPEKLSEKILLIDCHYTIADHIKCEQLIMFRKEAAMVLHSRAGGLA